MQARHGRAFLALGLASTLGCLLWTTCSRSRASGTTRDLTRPRVQTSVFWRIALAMCSIFMDQGLCSTQELGEIIRTQTWADHE